MDRLKETIAYLVWDAITNNVHVQFAGEPLKALGLVIFFSTFLMPFVMVSALQPLVAILNAAEYIGKKGILTLLTLCVKGVILSVLVVVLYFVSFFVMSSFMIICTKYYRK